MTVTTDTAGSEPPGPPSFPETRGFWNGSRTCSTRSGRLADEGHADLARAGLHRYTGDQLVLDLVARGALAALARRQREELDALAVDRDLELVRLAQTVRPRHLDANVVVAVEGKQVRDHRPTARAERQVIGAIVLLAIGRDTVGVAGRLRAADCPDRKAADRLRRGEIAFHEGRRHPQHAGDVVEAVAGVVGRQEIGDVHVERQQVADGVLVLGAVQPMECLGATRIRMGRRCAIERALEKRDKRVLSRSRRGAADRTAASHPPAAYEPPFPTSRDVRRRCARSSVSSARFAVAGALIVATDAVAIEKGLFGRWDNVAAVAPEASRSSGREASRGCWALVRTSPDASQRDRRSNSNSEPCARPHSERSSTRWWGPLTARVDRCQCTPNAAVGLRLRLSNQQNWANSRPGHTSAHAQARGRADNGVGIEAVDAIEIAECRPTGRTPRRRAASPRGPRQRPTTTAWRDDRRAP